jgi:CopG family transcriptional regulator/antitoxin EndoAI
MNKRINIVLPQATIQSIDRMVKPGQRSGFINQAVQHFVANRSTEAIRAKLERAAVRDQDIDRQVAADWFAVDQEAWQRLNTAEQQKEVAGRNGEKSISRRSARR